MRSLTDRLRRRVMRRLRIIRWALGADGEAEIARAFADGYRAGFFDAEYAYVVSPEHARLTRLRRAGV